LGHRGDGTDIRGSSVEAYLAGGSTHLFDPTLCRLTSTPLSAALVAARIGNGIFTLGELRQTGAATSGWRSWSLGGVCSLLSAHMIWKGLLSYLSAADIRW